MVRRIRGYQASLGANAKKLNQAPFKSMAHSKPARGSDGEFMLNDVKEKVAEAKDTKVVTSDIIDDLNFDVFINQSRANN